MERLNVVLEVATLGLGRGRGEACGGGRVGFGGGWLGFRRQRGTVRGRPLRPRVWSFDETLPLPQRWVACTWREEEEESELGWAGSCWTGGP
jgi:hypothetical protein